MIDDHRNLTIFAIGPLDTVFLIVSIAVLVFYDPANVEFVKVDAGLLRTAMGALAALCVLGILTDALNLTRMDWLSNMLFTAVHILMATAFSFICTMKLDPSDFMAFMATIIWAIYVVIVLAEIWFDLRMVDGSDIFMSMSLGFTLSMTFLMFCAYSDVSCMMENGSSYHPNGLELSMVKDVFMVCFAGLLASSVLITVGLRLGVPRLSLLFTVVAIAISAAGGFLYQECETIGFEYVDLVVISLGIVIPILNIVVNWDVFRSAKEVRKGRKHEKDVKNTEKRQMKQIRNIEKAIADGEAALAKMQQKGKLFE